MVNIIKEEIEIEESLESRLRVICDFCNTTPTIINGSIRRIDKTNLTYIEPHRIYIKNNLYLAFNYSSDIYVNNLGKKIKLFELEDYIKFRESVANVSNELYFNGYYDRYIPSIFGNIYGQIRFSEYLPEKEVGEQIMRLRQFYDVGYYEATYNVKNQVFYFNFIEDNKTLVRVFPLEDYRKIDPDMKLDTYNLGVIYVKEDNGTLLKNEDDVFKYIPAECDCNVVYSKEPIYVETKLVPYYEDEETEEVSS